MFIDSVFWFAVLQVLGLSVVPLTFRLLRRLPDKGYSFSKPVSLLLLGYIVWLGGSLGVLPATRLVEMLVVLGLIVSGLILFWFDRDRVRLYFKTRWRSVLVTEMVFLGLFLFWLIYRSFDPLIVSTEAPMDFAFLNASLIAKNFPPGDPWLAGYPVSYYYFGYLIVSVIAELTAVIPPVAYNLGLASFAGLTGVSVFGMGFNLALLARSGKAYRRRRYVRGWLLGMFGVVLAMGISNLLGIIELTRALGLKSQKFWDWLQIKGMETPVAETSVLPNDHWWWWRSSRVIDTLRDGQSLDYTITEFPFFSYLLGDMHPHVMAVPFFVLTVAVLCCVVLQGAVFKRKSLGGDLGILVCLSWMIGGTVFVNTWETAGLLLLCYFVYYRGFLVRDQSHNLASPLCLVRASGTLLFVVAGGVVMYLPFYLDFDSQASGIGLVLDPVTRYVHWSLVWGIFLIPLGFLSLTGAVTLLRRRAPRNVGFVMPMVIAMGPFAVWAMSAFMLGESFNLILDRFFHNLPVLLVILITLTIALTSTVQRGDLVRTIVCMFCATAALLVVIPEMFYLVDAFNTRMNTMFKLYYQAWVLLAIATPCILYYAADWMSTRRGIARGAGLAAAGIFGVLLIGSFYYPFSGIITKAENFGNTPTLNGLSHVKRDSHGEYQAILWLWEHAGPKSRILEAIGNDYDGTTSRVSAATGIPTLLGWQGHEIQWRGTSRPLDGRAEMVEAIYTAGDTDELLAVLRAHEIDYVVLGPQERKRYGPDAGVIFAEAMVSYVFSEDFALYVVP